MPALKEKRKYTNPHQVPRLEKIVVNMGVSASLEKSAIDDAAKDLALITGRKAVVSKSRHSIANFKLREGQPIGCRVTLRRDATVCPSALLMVAEIIPWAWATRQFFRKLSWIKSSVSKEWTSPL